MLLFVRQFYASIFQAEGGEQGDLLTASPFVPLRNTVRSLPRSVSKPSCARRHLMGVLGQDLLRKKKAH